MEGRLNPEIERFGDPWPVLEDDIAPAVLFLIHASTPLEERLVGEWVKLSQPEFSVSCSTIVMSGPRDKIPDHEGLASSLENDGATIVVPIHVAWRMLQTEKLRLRQLLLGDPREPNRWKQARILAKKPMLIALVAAKSATIDELRARHSSRESQTGPDAFAGFVVRQAVLSLERAERGIKGMRHKMPRFVRETLRAGKSFREAIEIAGDSGGGSVHTNLAKADEYLKEMVSVPRSFFVDFSARFFRFMYTRGYEDKLVYSEKDLDRVRQLIRQHPVVFCFTHKSHVDAGALICLLHDNGFPMLHTFGGINMAFLGLGSLLRRSGLIFIRRSFQNNPVYKMCLRLYIAYLLEKHFPLAWAIEGTRSRTGKLMPPKLGILKYVVEAAKEVNSGNLHIVPVSIVYDLIPDVADYVAEQGGHKKTAESLSWFFSYVLGMRKPHGRISLEFGEHVEVESLTETAENAGEPETFDLQKIAFEVCVNVNRVTPITSSSLIAMVLLGAAPQALTYSEVSRELGRLIAWARKRNLPMSSDFYEATEERFLSIVESMISMGIITRYDEGPDEIYMISRDQDLLVSYYRNTAIHFCFHSAIIELSLLKASDPVSNQAPLQVFWDEVFRLRDLLKFEFFYSPAKQYRIEISEELTRLDTGWSALIEQGKVGIDQILGEMRPFFAHATLRAFFEAYSVVADVLLRSGDDAVADKKLFLASCLKSGKQAYLQRRISSEESIGGNMFDNGLTLVKHLNLVGDKGLTSGDQKSARLDFARELKDILRRIQLIQTIAISRHNTSARE